MALQEWNWIGKFGSEVSGVGREEAEILASARVVESEKSPSLRVGAERIVAHGPPVRRSTRGTALCIPAAERVRQDSKQKQGAGPPVGDPAPSSLKAWNY